MENYKISIIIPIYNGEQYVDRCFENILKQSLDSIEIVFVDNNSSDNTYEYIKNIEAKHSNVAVYKELQRGAGAARNNGILNACGKYIFFLDVDDYIPDNDALEELYKLAEEKKSDLTGGRLLWYVDGKLDIEKTNNNPLCKITDFNNECIFYRDYQYDYGYYAFLYKTSFLRGNSLFFPNFIRHQDPPFFVNAMIVAQRFYVCNVNSYAYKCNSTVKTLTKDAASDVISACWEELKIAAREKLYKLAENVLLHINGTAYCWPLVTCIDNSKELIRLLIEFDDFVEIEFPELYKKYGGVKALVAIENLPERIMKKDESIKRKNEIISQLKGKVKTKDWTISHKIWRFPYEAIGEDSNIIIWGAGNVGKDIYMQASNDKRFTVIAWVDSNFKNFNNPNISDPSKITEYNYDYIIIASSIKKIVSEIHDELIRHNISEDIIVDLISD